MSDTPARTFDVRHLQLARALFALTAGIMITFSGDHSAAVGLAVFSGFAVATALVQLLSAWLVFPAGSRWTSVLIGILTMLAGMLGGVAGLRTSTMFFALVIVWALATGAAELASGIVARRRARALGASVTDARDAIVVGAVTILLGLALLAVPAGYQLDYFVDDAGQWFTLTGTTIGVGIFGAYAAIVGVYLGIAGFSPRRAETDTASPVVTETGGLS
ncbi:MULTISPECIES: acyl-CoA synthetase [unclassified Microbacterium]|uniref:acyl-CoA synthetase n=1 Tax=unclassified Microbacterium TaxID=2609290 RepID=UPI00214B0910|nr:MULTISPECIES: acyl-CoA synthetase [unclassified Microbacterium]MCR2783116.1 acyl-CoA synthetase [Microbacterium sp. zg.B96]MDL5352099.1 acyl-CoA synthetase [Microbacterium sp. zg-YB36]WIM16001.1 acyl-CoA synthetase [Microbacterium sp. zg-B96]